MSDVKKTATEKELAEAISVIADTVALLAQAIGNNGGEPQDATIVVMHAVSAKMRGET